MKRFNDYTCQQLVGQFVLFHTAFRDGRPPRQFVATVVKANRHHFVTSRSTQLQFDYSGRQLLKTNATEQSQLSTCILLTTEQAHTIAIRSLAEKQSKLNTELAALNNKTKEIISKLKNLQEI